MQVEFETLTPDARAWIFASPSPLEPSTRSLIDESVGQFVSGWESHGTPVPAASRLLHDQFLLVAVDDSQHPSGCSVDKLFRLVSDLSRRTGGNLLDPQRIWFRDARGEIRSATRPEFRSMAASGEVGPDTPVFDLTVERLAEVDRFERPAAESWHRELL